MAIDPVVLGHNLALLDELYGRFCEDPDSVDPGLRDLFRDGHSPESLADNGRPAPRTGNGAPARQNTLAEARARNGGTRRHSPATLAPVPAAARFIAHGHSALGIWPLVGAYRAVGHKHANLDPLGLLVHRPAPELDPDHHGFGEADLAREYAVGGLFNRDRMTVGELLDSLRRTYCGTIGLESVQIQDGKRRSWLNRRMEQLLDLPPPSPEARRYMLEKLIAAESLERFCHTKFPGTKRFSLEGSESVIPMLERVLDEAGRLGAIEAVIGMAHRGRLNVMVQTMQRKARDLFSEFEDIEPEVTLGGGDVKYHLGYSSDRVDANGNTMHVSLAFNPSHLEAVDPVVVGRVRAKQRRHGDWERRRILGILIHGDAAFAGQGLVPETLQLSNLHGYRTGGTVHIIVNNQIGFTATPQEARSTPYCTDVAMMLQCPIWHVNGEDLDAVYRVVEMAMEYRDKFQSDVVIDMFCYRKFGHNEMDEPKFTQPIMYQRIQQKEPIDTIYGAKLIEEGVLSSDGIEAIRKRFQTEYEQELAAARELGKRPVIPAMHGVWSPYVGGDDAKVADVVTGVSREILREISDKMNSVPEGIHVHPKVNKLLETRMAMGRGEKPLDWGCAEMLAYGSLLNEGTMVRLSGQDSCRGTFSHRHATVIDIDNGTEYMLLGHLHPDQGECRIYDSPLSEAAVLGFEFGYSLDYPDGLVIWEAQFGDFANGAQVIIDQFIMSSEDKWNRLSGLVLLLPHGYEGQGPEHSSARIERFLQGAAEDNIQIAQPTTPAQMFHLLRRQVHRPFRKPLIVLTPKSLLRLPKAVSDIDDLTTGTFRRFLCDGPLESNEQVERIFLCTGRVAYDLVAERAAREDARSVIIRFEQIYPWRPEELLELVGKFPNAKSYVWVQDEPANMGAGRFMMRRLMLLFGYTKVRMVSRLESASPATGSHRAHAIEQRQLLDEAFAEVTATEEG